MTTPLSVFSVLCPNVAENPATGWKIAEDVSVSKNLIVRLENFCNHIGGANIRLKRRLAELAVFERGMARNLLNSAEVFGGDVEASIALGFFCDGHVHRVIENGSFVSMRLAGFT